MLTPEQVAEMMNRGEMSPKGFALWLAAHDKEVREQAAQRVAADIRANNGCYDLGDTHIESIVAAARKEDTLLHADNCDRILGCTCGTRIEIVRGGEQA